MTAPCRWRLLQLAAAGLMGLWLVRHEIARAAPIIPFDLLRIRLFSLSVATSVASFIAQMAALVALPFEIQRIGHSAVETGLLMTPWPAAIAVAAPIAGRLADRYPAGILGGAGLVVLAIGLALLATFPTAAAGRRFHLAHGAVRTGIRILPVTEQPSNAVVRAPRAQRRRRRHARHGAPARVRRSARPALPSCSVHYPAQGSHLVAVGRAARGAGRRHPSALLRVKQAASSLSAPQRRRAPPARGIPAAARCRAVRRRSCGTSSCGSSLRPRERTFARNISPLARVSPPCACIHCPVSRASTSLHR